MPRKILSKSEALFLKDVGRNLRVIRRSRGLTQKEFAQMLDLSREGYANYELGKREMGIITLRDIRIETQMDPLVPDPVGFRPELAPLPGRGAKTYLPAWVTRVLSHRDRAIAAREAFDQEMLSAFGRRLKSIREAVFTSCTIAAALRLYVPEFYWSRFDPATQIDWSLLIGFGTSMLLLPFQMWYMARFLYWMHRRR